ncbi:MAG: hypothetical protein A2934_02640 [Candidatus Sungbacteria bacterium RIFCSPLOWO2_01_FULL_47_10]|uniref:Thioredoxin domain-containing protein n=1 Tax=Candidatus Sungbacteria bacterium RIFCSPLOWO2_01_FULL_47_10 TaxID=1802276 RepID=A0A1G2L1J1_9BACT|nr:MAG: hypothetical protein A2934_02640 [Candidatus Sungbacteria bacterium RIFCSPLOWO2_01_FULL_47_10]
MTGIDQIFEKFSLEAYDPESGNVVRLHSHELLGAWVILFFYPADFTFVCPTELVDINRHADEFKKYNAEVIAVSTDTVYTHKAWLEIEELLKGFKFRMAADHNGKFSQKLGIYDEEKGVAMRAVYIIDPEGVLRSVEIVSDSIGRNAAEVVRKLKALDFVRNNPGKVCPARWEEGETVLEPAIRKAGHVHREYKK